MKRFLVLVIGIALIVGATSIGGAAVYTFEPTPADLYDLDHYNYYTWGVHQSFGGEQIDSVSLEFKNIQNWTTSPNALYINLIDTSFTGVAVGYDDPSTPGNEFAGQGVELSVSPLSFPYYPSQNYSYSLIASELASFRSYSADGFFGFGFDPDCHYWNDGIRLTVNTTNAAPVPEPSTMILLGTGLVGLAGWGRKKFRN